MSKAKGFLLAAAVAAMVFFLSCSEDLKPIDRETWEDYQKTLSSSGGVPSSSSSVPFSSSAEPSSSSEAPSSSSAVSLCVGVQYNPDTQFCHNNGPVDKCNGNEYNPPEEVCSYGVVGKMCGSTWYNHQTYFCLNGTSTPLCGEEEYTGSQFCRSGKVYDKCGGIDEYDPSKYYCHNDSLSSCGNLPFNPDKQFCLDNARYDKCGGTEEYAPETHFCYNNSKVGLKCGARTEIFDPDLYQCKSQINPNGIYLKTPVSYGGESYEAVLIGTQTWMAKNLNYKTPDGTSRCYPTSGNTNASDANNSNCSIYGRLYTWSAAMNGAANSTANPSGVQGVCPSGWHIPRQAEWTVLTDYIGGENTAGTKLKAAHGWKYHNGASGNGTDDYGFSALPGGLGGSDGSFFNVGDYGDWWSASEGFSSSAYGRLMGYDFEGASWGHDDKSNLFSVRCLQD